MGNTVRLLHKNVCSLLRDIYDASFKRENSLFMHVQSVSTLTDGILLFYSEISCQKSDATYLLRFSFGLQK